MPYWFNTRTQQVESHDDPRRARSGDLMGPYESEDEAARAYEIAAQRTARWDDEDRAEQEWATGDAERAAWNSNPLDD